VRLLDRQSNAAEFEALEFDSETSRKLKEYSQSKTGLVLVTGPTGSGKTTTLYAMIKQIDPTERWIQTIENPIEYRHGLWFQYEVPKAAGEEKGAAKLLKGLLRNAPDVCLVGEVRDAEVGNILLELSNTGHLVFSTLHNNNAALALTRLKNFGLDMYGLASVLQGILAQRLVRTLCRHCSIEDN
jgi:type II secretory ATPase GspE/PulE/Tfp pilus assembly ATPase PilB-like protein